MSTPKATVKSAGPAGVTGGQPTIEIRGSTAIIRPATFMLPKPEPATPKN